MTGMDEIALAATVFANCSNRDTFAHLAECIRKTYPQTQRKVVVSDLDGTLLVRDFSAVCAVPFLDKIRALGEVLFILTNQGGIAMRLAMQRQEKGYPDWPGTEERILAGMRLSGAKMAFVSLYHPEANIPQGELLAKRAEEIGLPVLPPLGFVIKRPEGYVCASWNPLWRKPSGFVLHLISQFFSPVIFVGDEESDEHAAKNAGVEYVAVEKIAEGNQQPVR